MQVIIRTLDQARESRAELIVQNDGDGEQTVTMVEKNAEIRITEQTGTGALMEMAARDRAERELKEAKDVLAEQIEKFEQALRNIDDKHQRELAAVLAKVDGYDKDRRTEKDRADANREWAERAEARVNKLTENATKAMAILGSEQVQDAQANCITKLSDRMSRAIDEAKAALTSQA